MANCRVHCCLAACSLCDATTIARSALALACGVCTFFHAAQVQGNPVHHRGSSSGHHQSGHCLGEGECVRQTFKPHKSWTQKDAYSESGVWKGRGGQGRGMFCIPYLANRAQKFPGHQLTSDHMPFNPHLPTFFVGREVKNCQPVNHGIHNPMLTSVRYATMISEDMSWYGMGSCRVECPAYIYFRSVMQALP